MKDQIQDGRASIETRSTALGIELGSTRIKLALIDLSGRTLATASYEWESHLEGDLWSYVLDEVWRGIQSCMGDVIAQVGEQYGTALTGVGAIGVSAMMHGYLAFGRDGHLLTPFRTWRNTNTGPAVEQLVEALGINIPHRWSAAHLFQAVLDEEDHADQVGFMTTLSGYIHWKLTGRRVLGIGDASGMFPIDDATRDYDQAALEVFNGLVAQRGHSLLLRSLLPEIKVAGEEAGTLSPEGAALLDPSGTLQAGVPLCPPEGDAGTGMVATNSVAPRTGNISAGTSLFAMVVLDRPLPRGEVNLSIDPVTTPAGDPVAMVHLNNGNADLDSWVGMFATFLAAAGIDLPRDDLFRILFESALSGETDAGGVVAYNTVAGEPIIGLDAGLPLVLRNPESRFTVGNLMRAHLFSMFAPLRIGMDTLFQQGIGLDRMFAHGGIFRTPGVAQSLLAAALETPILVDENAGEGGAWGMAVLALYAIEGGGSPLAEYLERHFFSAGGALPLAPKPDDVEGFQRYMVGYRRYLSLEQTGTAV